MTTKTFFMALLVAIILASCTPATIVAPTETTVPTSTFTPVPSTPKVTPTPTLTPTPAPLDYSIFPDFTPCTQDEDGGTVELWKCPYQKRNDFFVGGWVTDYMAVREWNKYFHEVNPLDVMKKNGFQWVKTCVITESSPTLARTPFKAWDNLPWKNEYWSSQEYAAQILKEASSKGYHLDLCFFLSDQAADAGRQNIPKKWESLTLEELTQVVEEYTYQTTMYFQQQGLKIELYEIGNEIEWGILGYTPESGRIPNPKDVDKTRDMVFMMNSVWPTEATLLKSAIAGVKRANPNAKIVLHIGSIMNFNNDDIANRMFFKSMIDEGVDFDYAGLSNTYPVPNWPPGGRSRDWYYTRFLKTIDFITNLNKPILLSEGAYSSFPYQDGILPITDYPFSQEGQATWIRDQLRFASNHPNIKGVFYFYPDHFRIENEPLDQGMSLGLFTSTGIPLPGMLEFRVALP